eukprot:TRINITY_DN6986_c0_g1_i1.p1 TRINITY_DN6986_c0_g1~~TRINITY_DN6986_c0_g1_i1.p1  ORF type:complete len:886 (-),score=196.44 TRINITY_DN6986_c0_g1_i1:310-2841(-)
MAKSPLISSPFQQNRVQFDRIDHFRSYSVQKMENNEKKPKTKSIPLVIPPGWEPKEKVLNRLWKEIESGERELNLAEIEGILTGLTSEEIRYACLHQRYSKLMIRVVKGMETKSIPYILKFFPPNKDSKVMFESADGGKVVTAILSRVPFDHRAIAFLKDEIMKEAVNISKSEGTSGGVLTLQKFIEECDEDTLTQLLVLLKNEIARLPEENHLLLFKLMERSRNTKHYDIIYRGLKGRMVQFCKHKYTKMISVFLFDFPPQYLEDSLDEIFPHLKELSMDPTGCTTVQAIIDGVDPNKVQVFVDKLFPHILELSHHQFGHFVVQKLIQVCSSNKILDELAPHLIELYTHESGTFVAQELMRRCNDPEQYKILAEALKGKVGKISHEDSYKGIAFKLLDFPLKYSSFAFQEVLPQFSDDDLKNISMDTTIERASAAQLVRIIESLSPHFVELSSSLWGSLVVQKLIEKCNEPIHYLIILKGLRGKIVQFCKSKSSKFFVPKILEFPPQYYDIFIKEINTHLKELSMDVNGIVSMQNVIKKSSQEQLTSVLRELSPHFLELSTHQFGNLVLFDLSKSCSTPINYRIMSDALRGKIVQLCKSKSYTTLGYLLRFPPEHCNFVMEEILPNLKKLSMDANGCLSIQSVIEKADDQRFGEILRNISPHLLDLFTHEYGSYVVKKLISESKEPLHYEIISNGLKGTTIELCKSRFSNVALKHLLGFPPKYSDFVVDEVLPNLPALSMDVNATLAIQNIVGNANTEQKGRLLNRCTDHFYELSVNKFGTFVLQKLISSCTSPSQTTIIKGLMRVHGKKMSQNAFGCYAVEEYLKTYPSEPSFITQHYRPK